MISSGIGSLGSVKGVVLRRTELAEAYVLLLLLVSLGATWVFLRVRASDRAILKSFAAAGVAFLVAVTALGVMDFATVQELTWEDGVLEWLTAHALLIAWLLAALILIRELRSGRPSPATAVLATGLFLCWGRELAWGRPFSGQRLWYSRNLFRLKPYLDPAYFQRFRESEALTVDPMTLYWAHLAFSGLFALLLLALGIYVARHRRRFVRELRERLRQVCGRLFLLGVGCYFVAQVLGHLFKLISQSDAARAWHKAHGVLGHRVVDEPIELLGAVAFLLSAVTLWRWRFRSEAAAEPSGGEPDGAADGKRRVEGTSRTGEEDRAAGSPEVDLAGVRVVRDQEAATSR
jgi:hypothetical protein